jgi:hypothetical protein
MSVARFFVVWHRVEMVGFSVLFFGRISRVASISVRSVVPRRDTTNQRVHLGRLHAGQWFIIVLPCDTIDATFLERSFPVERIAITSSKERVIVVTDFHVS